MNVEIARVKDGTQRCRCGVPVNHRPFAVLVDGELICACCAEVAGAEPEFKAMLAMNDSQSAYNFQFQALAKKARDTRARLLEEEERIRRGAAGDYRPTL